VELSELLMVEHAALRIRLHELLETQSQELFQKANRFVLECHAKVEDEVFFPVLYSQISESLKKLEADHKLILTLSSSLLNFVKQGKEELFRKRVKTYVTTVLEHNQQEEILVFPYWKSVSNDTAKSALEHVKRIIQAFGVDEYLEFTGMSKQFFDSL
jgi:hemerythrin superfamily protein